MSNAADGAASTTGPGVDAGHDVQFDEATEARLERAVDELVGFADLVVVPLVVVPPGTVDELVQRLT